MVKVYDVTIKNLKSFKDHEGCEIAQGEIWKGKEHLGFWSQDSWGGEDIFEFLKDMENLNFQKRNLLMKLLNSKLQITSIIFLIEKHQQMIRKQERTLKNILMKKCLFTKSCTE